jgi:hypothetical protein
MPSLVPNMVYHYRVDTVNGGVVSAGNDVSFIYPFVNNPMNASVFAQAIFPLFFFGALLFILVRSSEDAGLATLAAIIIVGAALLTVVVLAVNGL